MWKHYTLRIHIDMFFHVIFSIGIKILRSVRLIVGKLWFHIAKIGELAIVCESSYFSCNELVDVHIEQMDKLVGKTYKSISR